MVQPINLIFRFLQNKARVSIWLYENQSQRVEGTILGFDEYMNVVLENAEFVYVKSQHREKLGAYVVTLSLV